MRILAIDTSGPALSLALFEGKDLVAERHDLIGRGHAELIIPAIAALPGGGRADIIIAGCGPGSFTGIRAGIAAARALALGWNAKAFGMSSMALVAAGVEAAGLVVALEGGHGALFVQSFTCSPLASDSAVESLSAQEAAAQYQQGIVVGSGADQLVAVRGHGQVLASEPRASRALLLPLALREWPPSPVYGRPPDAKVAV
jgi:tRNA threonylcarbamoyladenosine biosynthesis protein TsaB